MKYATKQCDFHFPNFYFVNKLQFVVSLGGLNRDVLNCIYFNCTVAWSSTSWRLISTSEYLLHCCVKMTVTCYSSYSCLWFLSICHYCLNKTDLGFLFVFWDKCINLFYPLLSTAVVPGCYHKPSFIFRQLVPDVAMRRLLYEDYKLQGNPWNDHLFRRLRHFMPLRNVIM